MCVRRGKRRRARRASALRVRPRRATKSCCASWPNRLPTAVRFGHLLRVDAAERLVCGDAIVAETQHVLANLGHVGVRSCSAGGSALVAHDQTGWSSEAGGRLTSFSIELIYFLRTLRRGVPAGP